MAVKFFGQFLLEKGAVGNKDLLKAIELQETTNLKFGATALSMGLLTVDAFERVHDAQRLEDLKFGDMAVNLGILTEEQVKQVLTRQKNNHLYIGEALVRIGALNSEDLKKHLDDFKEDQAPYVIDRIVIPPAVPNANVWEVVADLTFKMLVRIAGLSARPGMCQITDGLDPSALVAVVPFKGSVNGRYILNVSTNIRKAMAKAILKEDDVENEPREVLDDTVMEFANIVCGNVAAKAAQLGLTFDIDPPYLINGQAGRIKVAEGEAALLFPVYVADGDTVELALFIGRQ
ncbi:MAG: chemotaxis protein CheX [Desulfuromonadaceae bacterium GWC2_58_13]|nr:MAG: chemotaxis protein CheX [Desulfuromonadaceae bacterium GWC2_58_13]